MQEIRTIDRVFYRKLGSCIRKARTDRKMTQKQLADAIGYPRTMITHWELGYNKIKPSQFSDICDVLKLDKRFTVDVELKSKN